LAVASPQERTESLARHLPRFASSTMNAAWNVWLAGYPENA
jgi:hypothetical protein